MSAIHNDASDPALTELKLWRDTSQDGRTGSGELITLAGAGIVSLNLAAILKNQGLANGSFLSREDSLTARRPPWANCRLATSTFRSKVTEDIIPPDPLPTMGGAGNVGELQQAVTLFVRLVGELAQFQDSSTRVEQKALFDQFVTRWADTSGMDKSLEECATGKYRIQHEAFGNGQRSSSVDTEAFAAVSFGRVGSRGGAVLMTDFCGQYLCERYRNLISELSRKPHVLGAFKGQYFFNPSEKTSKTGEANWSGLADFDTLPQTGGVTTRLDEFKVKSFIAGGNPTGLTDKAEIVLAGDGNDRLFERGNDDHIYGSSGDDLISGGAGNDVLAGESGADTYVFGRGYGSDTIGDYAENGIQCDTVRMPGLNPADIRVTADYSDNLFPPSSVAARRCPCRGV